MSDDVTTDDTSGDATGASTDYRQVSLVALAALALVLAALFAPGVADRNGSNAEIDSGENGDAPESGSGSDVDPSEAPEPVFDWTELLEWFDVGGDDEIEVESTDPTADSACVIVLDRDPTPGGQVTATIYYESEPLTDVPVWFNDRRVGETNAEGRVTGTVPYAEQLRIRAGTAAGTTCLAADATLRSAVSSTTTESHQSSETATMGATTTAGFGDRTPALRSVRAATTQDDQANTTVEYEVDGEVEIAIGGEPTPGETVTVEAAIDDVPMREAAVSVDGERVATTDEDGTAALSVPDDGTDEFELEVARGDFSGAVTVDVLLLEATLVPGGLAPVPGSDGAVEATIDDEPVADAAVIVGGDHRGTTDADGRLALELPRDPTTPVTVRTDDQTATVTLVGAYGGLAAILSLLVAGAAVVSARAHGVRGPVVVLAVAAGLAAVLVAEAFYGTIGGLLALGVLVPIGIGAILRWSDAEFDGERPAPRDGLERLVAWLVERTLRLVDVLEAWLDRARVLAGRLRERLGSPSELRAWLAAGLRTVPNRVLAAFRRGLEAFDGVSYRAVAAVVAAGALTAGGYAVGGVRGAAIVAAVLAAGGAVAVRRRRGSDDGTETEADSSVDDADATDDSDPAIGGTERRADEPLSFRELWRAFARQVAPRRWQTSTPGEIERRAVERDYPREPVRELTTLFREVEYGGRPRSDRVRERAADAADELARTRTREHGRDGETRSEREPEIRRDGAPPTAGSETDARREPEGER